MTCFTCVVLYCSLESLNKSQKFGHSSLPWYDQILLTSRFVMISGKTSQFIKRPKKRPFGLGHSFNNSYVLDYFAKKNTVLSRSILFFFSSKFKNIQHLTGYTFVNIQNVLISKIWFLTLRYIKEINFLIQLCIKQWEKNFWKFTDQQIWRIYPRAIAHFVDFYVKGNLIHARFYMNLWNENIAHFVDFYVKGNLIHARFYMNLWNEKR